MINEQVFFQAQLLAGEITQQQSNTLKALCDVATSSLKARLRSGLSPEDCQTDFVNAASLMALAALAGISGDVPVEQITVGDFTIRKGVLSHESASACLRTQAVLLMAPYLKDRFSFMGV